MSAALKVVQPGLCTTLQDLGRVGHQALGVPVAGALDPVALRLANALVGNPENAAGLEILMQGPTFEVEADSVRVALAGTDTPLEILGDEPRRLPPWRSATLTRGQQLRIGVLQGAASAILAVAGGFAVAPCMGSLSTYVRGAIGGFHGRPLRMGDAVPLKLDAAPDGGDGQLARAPDLGHDDPIRIVLGPQADYFTDAAIRAFLAGPYTVSREADRMGMRLEGPELQHRETFNIVSDGIANGAIQVPGSRQPILLLADRQTTGGYPKIATVISADLPKAGRRRPGDRIRFAAVEVAEAERLARAAEAEIAKIVAGIQPAVDAGSLDLASLYAGNLISGVVSGTDG